MFIDNTRYCDRDSWDQGKVAVPNRGNGIQLFFFLFLFRNFDEDEFYSRTF